MAEKKTMALAIGSDHRGYALKQHIIANSAATDQYCLSWHDVGTHSCEKVNYPVFARAVVTMVLEGEVSAGVLLCGTGVGMSIAANRYPGIWAALAWNRSIARLSKEDDNANILVIPADYVSPVEGVAMIAAWLDATFKQGLYAERLRDIDRI